MARFRVISKIGTAQGIVFHGRLEPSREGHQAMAGDIDKLYIVNVSSGGWWLPSQVEPLDEEARCLHVAARLSRTE